MQDRSELGSADAFEVLYAHERLPMVRLAFLLTGSLEAAEDAVQESFARVHPRIDELDRPGAYLRTCVVNATRSWHRRERATPPRRRRALVLRYWGDLSTGEIAEAMECRPGTVSSLLHRGLADLRKELEPHG